MKANRRHLAGITIGILGIAGYALAASLGSEKYTYDASGNIIEKSIDGKVTRMAYDHANRVILQNDDSMHSVTFVYDACGMISKEMRDDQPIREYEYGWLGKLIRIRNGDESSEFYYNANGMLLAKRKNGVTEAWAWDGFGLVLRDSAVFANEGHISGGVPAISTSEDIENPILTDYLGTSLGNQTSFGQGVQRAEDRFTGKPFDGDLNGIVYPTRLFRPDLCRWMEPDPLSFPDGCNTYAYASCPTSSLDPTGLIDMNTMHKIGTATFTQDGTGISWPVDVWEVKTDDHAKTIQLYESLVKQAHPEYTYNCHGYVFGGAAYWINNNYVADILSGDKWKTVAETDVKANVTPYIGVYEINKHSVKVTEWVDGDVKKVKGKGGVSAAPVETTPEAGWTTGQAPQFYEK